ncbi:MAG: 1-acyl-sn-glycerol-3-phosphate acyltransferase [Verrucomicrobiaceae bacterium]|nr:MAG: 1-acyl-sn-glycerol-3-phosphate acyltransferase [Verrucomicrobiaceae bacterium]
MQSIVFDKPYSFVPPRFSRVWHRLMRFLLPVYLKKVHGIGPVECVGAEKLRASLDAGHGVMLVPNHCRPCDPMVLDSLAAEVRRPFHVIASWHLFMVSRIQRFLLPRMGGFSVYREGMDRESIKCAVKTVADGRHPLIIFAEGIITRGNDRLVSFMEGPAFIARVAAKQRPEGKVVIHPVFIRYFFEGDLEKTVLPVMADIEKRLAWQPQTQLPLQDRILKIGSALLDLKEVEYFGSAQPGSFSERLQRLEDYLLMPLEIRWCAGRHDGTTMSRVKRLRSAILPEMIAGDLTDEEKASRWRQLADLYLVQQLHCYPQGYFDQPTPERILETIERYEEDLTDVSRPHFPIRAVVVVGDAIEVGAAREKSQEADPITAAVRRQLEELLETSKTLRRVEPTGTQIS